MLLKMEKHYMSNEHMGEARGGAEMIAVPVNVQVTFNKLFKSSVKVAYFCYLFQGGRSS